MEAKKVEQITIDRALEKLSSMRLQGKSGPKDRVAVEELQAARRQKLVPSHQQVLKASFRSRFKIPA